MNKEDTEIRRVNKMEIYTRLVELETKITYTNTRLDGAIVDNEAIMKKFTKSVKRIFIVSMGILIAVSIGVYVEIYMILPVIINEKH